MIHVLNHALLDVNLWNVVTLELCVFQSPVRNAECSSHEHSH